MCIIIISLALTTLDDRFIKPYTVPNSGSATTVDQPQNELVFCLVGNRYQMSVEQLAMAARQTEVVVQVIRSVAAVIVPSPSVVACWEKMFYNKHKTLMNTGPPVSRPVWNFRHGPGGVQKRGSIEREFLSFFSVFNSPIWILFLQCVRARGEFAVQPKVEYICKFRQPGVSVGDTRFMWIVPHAN